MSKRQCAILVALGLMALGVVQIVQSATLVSVVSSTTGRVKSQKEVCCGEKVDIWKIDTPTYRDFNSTEVTTKNTAFEDTYTTHVNRIGDSTRAFNCHSYVFNDSEGVIHDVSPYEGTDPGCYEVDDAGPVYQEFTQSHSAFAGQNGFDYRGKVGGYPEADHDDFLFGAHTERWKQIEEEE